MILICAALLVAAVWFGDHSIVPRLFNSSIERMGEKDLPKIIIENGNTIYCRMSADDFRLPLPSGSHATNWVVAGGFDWADGTVEARFDSANHMAVSDYADLLAKKIPQGGQVTVAPIADGIRIKFHYFGDK